MILTLYSCTASAHGFFHFFARGHTGITRSGGGQSAVGRAVIHCLLRVIEFQETELQATGKAVTTADAVKDLKLGIFAAFEKFAVMPEDCAPVVLRGGD